MSSSSGAARDRPLSIIAMPAVLSLRYPSFYDGASALKSRYPDICGTKSTSKITFWSKSGVATWEYFGRLWERFWSPRGPPGSSQGPPGDSQESPREHQGAPGSTRGAPGEHQGDTREAHLYHNNCRECELPIARLWRPVCYFILLHGYFLFSSVFHQL